MNRDTICVQGGYTPGNGEPRQIPIIQSTTFKYATSEDMGKLFDLEADGYFYSRLQNPTCDLVAKKICELEGGTAAMLTSSGQAANFFALFNLCEAGDHIVASSTIYGGTFNLISVTMKKMGIDATFVDPLCTEEELNAAFRPNTKVVFGGDGEVEKNKSLAAELGIADRCEFHGWVAGAEREELFERAAVYCLPSKNEGLPMSVLEAMARGIPTVATPVGGIPQVINDGVNGVLIPVDNYQALAVALNHLLESSELRKEMGTLARKKILSSFDINLLLSEILGIYCNAVSGN